MVKYRIRFLKDVPGTTDWLHPSELELYASFRFGKRQKDWLLGRWTAKNLLRDCWFPTHILSEIAVLPGENRAPKVYVNGTTVPCRISISHSQGQSFCATSPEIVQIGCDLEQVEKRSEAFRRDYFTEQELELFQQNRFPLTEDQFFTLCWSAKEAVMKATRQGMSLHPRKIGVEHISTGNQSWNELRIKNKETQHDYFGRWQLNVEMVYVIVADRSMDCLEM